MTNNILLKIKSFIKKNIPEHYYRKIVLAKSKKDASKQLNAIYNIGNNVNINNQKRILFSYDISTYTSPYSSWGTMGHTHASELSCFIKALTEKGYAIDLVHHSNDVDIIADYYDVVIGLGNNWRKASFLNPTAKRVLYLTEKMPSFSKSKEEERITYLRARHNINISMERTGLFFHEEDFADLTAIIAIGIESDKQYLPNVPAWFILPTGHINQTFQIENRNIPNAKNHFLWFGSGGIVHKGLDILFDVFAKHPELTLHVCGATELSIARIQSICPSNVVIHGFVNVLSDEFLDIANMCAFDILPSCSESSATSVLTCMNHGIIPIVTYECGIESAGVISGEVLSDFKIETIEKSVVKWSNMDNNTLLKQMKDTINFAREEYCIQAFDKNINNIVCHLGHLLS